VVGKVDNAAEKALVETTAWPSTVLFFTSRAAAQNYVNASGGAVSPALQKVASAGQGALNTGTNAITGTAALIGKAGRFLDDLTSSAFWIRIAEVVAGLVLLAIGVNHLFASRPLSAVAGAAGKVAPLAMA